MPGVFDAGDRKLSARILVSSHKLSTRILVGIPTCTTEDGAKANMYTVGCATLGLRTNDSVVQRWLDSVLHKLSVLHVRVDP